MTRLAYNYDPQYAPDPYYIIAPEGKRIHYPKRQLSLTPLCGLKSGLGWETITVEWEHLYPLCQRCEWAQSHQIRKGTGR